MHSDIYHLTPSWVPSPLSRPPVGFDGHLSASFRGFPKVAYHAAKKKNIGSAILNGLFPGGLTTDGSPVKPFVMFSLEPNRVRTDNEGIRENAEIEVVVDVQLAALEDVRFLKTASGCLQTPDWVSNRYITFIYNRRSTIVSTACTANVSRLRFRVLPRPTPSSPSAMLISSAAMVLDVSWMLMKPDPRGLQ